MSGENMTLGEFERVFGRVIGGKHAKGWKGHRAWRARHRKHVLQRLTKRANAASRRFYENNFFPAE